MTRKQSLNTIYISQCCYMYYQETDLLSFPWISVHSSAYFPPKQRPGKNIDSVILWIDSNRVIRAGQIIGQNYAGKQLAILNYLLSPPSLPLLHFFCSTLCVVSHTPGVTFYSIYQGRSKWGWRKESTSCRWPGCYARVWCQPIYFTL